MNWSYADDSLRVVVRVIGNTTESKFFDALSPEEQQSVQPQVVNLPTLIARAKAETRIQRQPIIEILDGLQASALTLGNPSRAQVIETAKQGLRDITDTDLSACTTFEEMRLKVKAAYLDLARALPIDVRIAFSEALK